MSPVRLLAYVAVKLTSIVEQALAACDISFRMARASDSDFAASDCATAAAGSDIIITAAAIDLKNLISRN